jgi:acyl carrier protein
MTVVDEVNKQRIAALVSEVLEVDQDELTPTSSFKEDHGADSLQAIEVLGVLEREFNVEIDHSELSRMVNLQGLYDVVEEALKEKSA